MHFTFTNLGVVPGKKFVARSERLPSGMCDDLPSYTFFFIPKIIPLLLMTSEAHAMRVQILWRYVISSTQWLERLMIAHGNWHSGSAVPIWCPPLVSYPSLVAMSHTKNSLLFCFVFLTGNYYR